MEIIGGEKGLGIKRCVLVRRRCWGERKNIVIGTAVNSLGKVEYEISTDVHIVNLTIDTIFNIISIRACLRNRNLPIFWCQTDHFRMLIVSEEN